MPCSALPVHQVLIEKSIKGYKEIEYEVIRDRNDTAICDLQYGEYRPGRHPHRRLDRRCLRARR